MVAYGVGEKEERKENLLLSKTHTYTSQAHLTNEINGGFYTQSHATWVGFSMGFGDGLGFRLDKKANLILNYLTIQIARLT